VTLGKGVAGSPLFWTRNIIMCDKLNDVITARIAGIVESVNAVLVMYWNSSLYVSTSCRVHEIVPLLAYVSMRPLHVFAAAAAVEYMADAIYADRARIDMNNSVATM